MKLSRYLKNHSLTDAEFGALVDATVHAVRKWSRGERTPREKHMRRIVLATCGEVTPNDFLTATSPEKVRPGVHA